MAKNCSFYQIDYDAKDDRGWYTGNRGRFRDTPEGAAQRFRDATNEKPKEYSIRLVKCVVADQVNGVSTK